MGGDKPWSNCIYSPVILKVGGTLTYILVSVFIVLEDRSFEDLHLRTMK